jgi:hypothetical protein
MPYPSLLAESISEEQKPAPISVPLLAPNALTGHRIAEEHHKEKPIYLTQVSPT